MPRRLALLLLPLLSLTALAAPAAAAPPSNDDRGDARNLGTLPTRVTGTTQDATVEQGEPVSSCGATTNSTWYTFTAPDAGRVIAQLQANGDLDATVDVYRRVRSQTEFVGCRRTDKDGLARLPFTVRKSNTYLIRVARLTNSVEGQFSLDVGYAQPAARAPGAKLPAKGVRNQVDGLFNDSDAWSMRLSEGVTYRVNLALLAPPTRAGDDEDESEPQCLTLEVFGPNVTSFDEDVQYRRGCGGYLAFTPGSGQGGRYSFRISARGEAPQPYRLTVARAEADDTAPGIFIRNYQRMRGSLRGAGIDVVDLYRFDISKRADLTLRFSGGEDFQLVLLNDRGHRLDTSDGEDIVRRSSPGRYFAAVRATGTSSGSYTLTRITRTITRTSITINGGRGGLARPGSSASIAVHVTPAVTGPALVTIERFDPLIGWQFYSRVKRTVSGGSLTVPFTPPTVGRWRARAEYLGTRTSSPSETGFARVLVAGPLEE